MMAIDIQDGPVPGGLVPFRSWDEEVEAASQLKVGQWFFASPPIECDNQRNRRSMCVRSAIRKRADGKVFRVLTRNKQVVVLRHS